MAYLKRWPHTYQKDSLANWRAARANAASQPVDVMYYGNSLTQDGGSPVRFIEGGYPSHIGNWMNAKLGKQHGVGFDCARVTGGELHWTYTDNSEQWATYNPGGGAAYTPSTAGHLGGFGLWACALVPTDVMTYTGVMDRFDILYIKTKTFGTTIEVRIDGVLEGSFDTQDASQTGTVIGDFDASNTWTSPALTNESHIVTLTNVGSGSNVAYIEGIFAYNTNYDTGFRIWNGAHSGYWGGYQKTAPNSYDVIKKRQPALVIWGHFFNDKNSGNNAAYASATVDFITKVREYSPNTDILLTTEWQCPSWSTTPPHASYTDMRNAALYIAALNGVGVIDLGEFIESVGYNGVFNDPFKWLKADGTHQGSADGFLQWAKIHYAYLNDIKPPARPQGY